MRGKEMKKYKNNIICSCIIGFLVSGLLTNGFCIYVSLVFNKYDYFYNKVLFVLCGILFVVFLGIGIYNILKKIKYEVFSIKNIIKKLGITIFFTVLWIVIFWMVWACIINLFTIIE